MKIKKVFSRIHRKIILKYDYFSYSKYIYIYQKWLKKQGMDIKGNVKYIHHTVYFDGVDYSKIHLGNNIVISINCIILIHDYSIDCGLLAIKKADKKKAACFIKDVYIGNDCFIGCNCTILPGTTVGDNCIIGAGSVVPGKEYPANSIIAGNPAKVIGKTRDWALKKYLEHEYK